MEEMWQETKIFSKEEVLRMKNEQFQILKSIAFGRRTKGRIKAIRSLLSQIEEAENKRSWCRLKKLASYLFT